VLRGLASYLKDEQRKKEEGRRKKEEGRRKKEEGRRKKEEGRRKKEEGFFFCLLPLAFLMQSLMGSQSVAVKHCGLVGFQQRANAEPEGRFPPL
jgi:hypothetical protein